MVLVFIFLLTGLIVNVLTFFLCFKLFIAVLLSKPKNIKFSKDDLIRLIIPSLIIVLNIVTFVIMYIYFGDDFSYILTVLYDENIVVELAVAVYIPFIFTIVANTIMVFMNGNSLLSSDIINKKILLLGNSFIDIKVLWLFVILFIPFCLNWISIIILYNASEKPSDAIQRLQTKTIEIWEEVSNDLTSIQNAIELSSENLDRAIYIAENHIALGNREAILQDINMTRNQTYRYEDGIWIMWIEFSQIIRERSELDFALERNGFLIEVLSNPEHSEDYWRLILAKADFHRLLAQTSISENDHPGQLVNALTYYSYIERGVKLDEEIVSATEEIRKEAAIRRAVLRYYAYDRRLNHNNQLIEGDLSAIYTDMFDSEDSLAKLREDVSWINLISHIYTKLNA